MPRLIDADALKKHLHKDPLYPLVEKYGMDGVIDAQPTIDAVPVIRCKGCKYAKEIYIKNLPWLKQWEYSCAYFNTHSVMGDGFCSWAEPKDTTEEVRKQLKDMEQRREMDRKK